MTRNLDKRVELMTPVKSVTCKKKLMNILKVFAVDTYNSYTMNVNGDFEFSKRKDKEKRINAHEVFIRNACNQYKYKVPKKSKSDIQKW